MTLKLTDLQLFSSELHQNVFDDRAMPGPVEGSYSTPPDLLAIINQQKCPESVLKFAKNLVLKFHFSPLGPRYIICNDPFQWKIDGG